MVFSRFWFGPAPNPSIDIVKLSTRSLVIIDYLDLSQADVLLPNVCLQGPGASGAQRRMCTVPGRMGVCSIMKWSAMASRKMSG